MTTLREKIHDHLPIVFQFFSTTSLIIIALSAICGSQSLKELAESHEMNTPNAIEKFHEH